MPDPEIPAMNQQTPMDKFHRLQVGVLNIYNKSFPIYEGVNTVGRHKEAIINIKHLNISQNHGVIVALNGNHFISDLNSSNGTFVENCKIEPFKMFELKNNINISLGDLNGIYISQGPFLYNGPNNFEMTQEFTQSFYGSNTQILDNTRLNTTANDTEDIHNALTQEISWSEFKIPRNIKPVGSSSSSNEITTKTKSDTTLSPNTELMDEDIHNCETQVVSDPVHLEIPHINKQQTLLDKEAENITFKKKDVFKISVNNEIAQSSINLNEDTHDTPTQILPLLSKESGNINLANVGEDIHDAPTQILPLLSNKRDEINNTVIEESEPFGPFNDDELPRLQDSDNYVEIHQISEVGRASDIHAAVTQVIDISKQSISPITNTNLEDDEATDCEDNTDALLGNKKANTESCGDNKYQNTQDGATDREDNTDSDKNCSSLGQKNKSIFLESDDNSNDSMELFKIEKSFYKDSKELDVCIEQDNKVDKLSKSQSDLRNQTENCSDDSIHFKKKKVCHLSSSSDTDDNTEKISFRRKKKSAMVISTQDICEKEIDKKDKKNIGTRDSYAINDTDSETDIETEKNVYLEESIAATQNQSAVDLSDTDCIPATPHTVNPLPNKTRSPTNTDNVNGSSEESFKLGLTELMVPPQTSGNNAGSQDPCCSKNLKNISSVFIESDSRNDEIQLDDTDKTDIYVESTQPVKVDQIEYETDNKDLSTLHISDIYLAPTQKITKDGAEDNDNNGKNSANQRVSDIYLAPTQKITEDGTEDNDNNVKNSANQRVSDIYLAPTQRITNPTVRRRSIKILNDTEDLYEIDTQKLDKVSGTEHLDDTNNDFYLAPTQKVDVKKNLDNTNTDISFAHTLKVLDEVTDIEHNSSKDESMDELYLQPTQQLDNIFNETTQRVNRAILQINNVGDETEFTKPNVVIEKTDDINFPSKNKFKKSTFTLDGSLTNILSYNPKQIESNSSLQRQDRSSIEVEFIENVDNPIETSTRPSNPLSHVLENFDRHDHMVKLKEKEAVLKDMVSGNKNEKTKNDNKDIASVNDRNKISTGSKEKGILSDNTAAKEERVDDKSSISYKDQETADLDLPTRSSRTGRASKQNLISKKVENKTNLDISDSESNSTGKRKNKKSNNQLDVEPKIRRTTRHFASPSDIKVLDIEENKPQSCSDQSDNSLSAVATDVNQSVALLESRITKTRKTMKSVESLEVRVPKNRKSMTVSKTEGTINQEKNITDNTSSLNITTKKKGRPKKSQFLENETKNEGVNKPLRATKRTNNNLETVQDKKDTDASHSNLEGTSRTSKRQVGKRKQHDMKSDNNDAIMSSFQSVDSNLTTPKKQKEEPNRQAGKRKQPIEANSDNSDNNIQSLDSNFTTPKKQKLKPSGALLNTKERELRKHKPKVVFTMLESPQMESMIKQLGGSVIDSVDSCTVLLTEHVKRSQKLLSAVGLGKPICSPKWVTDSKKTHEFLDPWDYILTDSEAEKKWDFSLKESLNRSRTLKLLNGYNFHVQVTNAAEVLKGAIESCGGRCIPKIPSQPLENTFIISAQEHQSKYRRITKQHPSIKVIEPEAIFDGVLRQELRFSKHYLS